MGFHVRQGHRCFKCQGQATRYDPGTNLMLCDKCWFATEPLRRKQEESEPGTYYLRRHRKKDQP
jgi:hypothetical protein